MQNEYELQLQGVREIFKGFMTELDIKDRDSQEVGSHISKIIGLRYKPGAPRRQPQVVIVGPPGSGRQSQSKLLAEQFGLVHVCVRKLLKEEIEKNPDTGRVTKNAMDNGQMIPDEIISQLVEKKLQEAECRINGWVMDGFPATLPQINTMIAMDLKPTLVLQFDQSLQESLDRLLKRRHDPVTGDVYNLNTDLIQDPRIKSRLVHSKEDRDSVVKQRYAVWSSFVQHLEEQFKDGMLQVV